MNDVLAMFGKVGRLEAEVAKLQQVDLGTTHALAGGVYARTILIPAGVVLTGARHKKDHINVMQGDISVSTDDGVKRLTGQHVITTKAGMKRAGYAYADIVWTTLCHSELTDIEAIEADLVEEPERLQTRTLQIEQREGVCLSES